jgi:hypothetical protein
MRQIARELREQYTLGFVPLSGGGEGDATKIKVELTSPNRRRLRIRTRREYLDPRL